MRTFLRSGVVAAVLAGCGSGGSSTSGATLSTSASGTGSTSTGAATTASASSTSGPSTTSGTVGAATTAAASGTTASGTTGGATTGASAATTGASAGSTTGATASTTAGATTSATAGATTSGSSSGTTGGGSQSCAVLGEGSNCTTSDGLGGLCCAGACVDVAHDPANCQLCNRACPTDSVCVFGVCLSDGGAVVGCGASCPNGTTCATSPYGDECLPSTCTDAEEGANCATGGTIGTCCGTTCTDLNSDSNNCGFCLSACATGEACNGGTCAGNCPAGTRRYGGACLALTCTAQEQGQYACAYDAGMFPGLGTCCSSACVDTLSDSNNCQFCGNACAEGSFCNYGFCPVVSCVGVATETQCILPGGGTNVGSCCNGTCVDTNSDIGACNFCGLVCPSGDSCQSGVCYDSSNTFFDCGSNPSACPVGTVCTGESCTQLGCAGQQDGTFCAFGPQVEGQCCGGACADLATDPRNCGACGFGSADGVCLGGLAYPTPPDAGTCGGCPADEECDGPYCVDPSCELGGVCFTDDGGVALCCAQPPHFRQSCVDVENDPANCGNCGVTCPSGQACVSGQCSGTEPACGAGQVGGYCALDAGLSFLCCPGGGCTDTSSAPSNCGTCGNVCDTTCTLGVCD